MNNRLLLKPDDLLRVSWKLLIVIKYDIIYSFELYPRTFILWRIHPKMLPEIENNKRSSKETLPRYRIVPSIPNALFKTATLVLLSVFMAFAGYQSFGALQRVITCAAPVQSSTTDTYDEEGYNYDRFSDASDLSDDKTCVPADLHASWLPALLGAVSMAALALMALVMFIYFLRLCADYIDQHVLQVEGPTASRGFHTLPDQFKHALKGLTLVSGIFMLASVCVYGLIYFIAL